MITVAHMPEKKLVIKVTAGAEAPERCSQAFTVAALAVASDVEVSLWLTGESAWFALPGRAAEFLFAPYLGDEPARRQIADAIERSLSAGG